VEVCEGLKRRVFISVETILGWLSPHPVRRLVALRLRGHWAPLDKLPPLFLDYILANPSTFVWAARKTSPNSFRRAEQRAHSPEMAQSTRWVGAGQPRRPRLRPTPEEETFVSPTPDFALSPEPPAPSVGGVGAAAAGRPGDPVAAVEGAIWSALSSILCRLAGDGLSQDISQFALGQSSPCHSSGMTNRGRPQSRALSNSRPWRPTLRGFVVPSRRPIHSINGETRVLLAATSFSLVP